MEFGILLRLIGVMNLLLVLSHWFSIQGENPTHVVSITQKKPQKLERWLILYVVRHFADRFLLDLDWAVHFDISVDDPDFHSRSQLYEKSKTSVHFSEKLRSWFGWNSVCCQNLLVINLFETHAKFICYCSRERTLLMRFDERYD